MRYRCPCGYEADKTPSAPNREIVSVYHIHRRADTRALAEIVRMEAVQTPSEARRREAEVMGAALK